MKLAEKIQMLRKNNGYSQEELAEKIGVSRQAIGKWECDQACPDIENLIELSNIFKITVDRLVKEDDECNTRISGTGLKDKNALTEFLICAKKCTYAGKGVEVAASRPGSHDLRYEEKDYLSG